MSVNLVDATQEYECCVCWTPKMAEWGALAKEGWRSHYAGYGVKPVILCGSCADHIADRREAHRKALEEELREAS